MRSLFLSFLLLFSSLYSQPLQVQPGNTLVFQNTSEISSRFRPMALINNQDFPVKVTGFTFFDTYGEPAFSTGADTFTLAPGKSKDIFITFRPRHNVYYESHMVIETDAGMGALIVRLEGQGIFSNSYYEGTRNQTEQALKDSLHDILERDYTPLTYNTARDKMFLEIDNQAVNGQGASVNTVECVYTGNSTDNFVTRAQAQTEGNLNTEHTFPQGLFSEQPPAPPMQSDMYHLFIVTEASNSQRGTLPYGIVNNPPEWEDGTSKKGNGVFEPRDVHKGVVARAIFYFVVRYDNGSGFLTSAQEAVLRNWYAQFPPDSLEKNRNEAIHVWQKNRNPFIDYPQFLERISSIRGNSVSASETNLFVSSDEVDFRQVPQSTTRRYTLALVNTGNQVINVNNISVSGNGFELAQNMSVDTLVEVGSAIYIPVEVNDNVIGNISGTLSLSTNVPGQENLTLPLLAEIVMNPSSIEEQINRPFSIFPNPSGGIISLVFKSEIQNGFGRTGMIYDLNGKEILKFELQKGRQNLDLSEFAEGRYIVEIEGLGSRQIEIKR